MDKLSEIHCNASSYFRVSSVVGGQNGDGILIETSPRFVIPSILALVFSDSLVPNNNQRQSMPNE